MWGFFFNRNSKFDASFPSRRVSDDQIMLEEAWRNRERKRQQQRRNRASSCPVVKDNSRVGRRLSDHGSRFEDVAIASCSADRANRSRANDNIPTFTSFKRTTKEGTLQKARSLYDVTKPPKEVIDHLTIVVKVIAQGTIKKYNKRHPNRPWQECRGPSSDSDVFCRWSSTEAQLNRLVDELNQEAALRARARRIRDKHVATIKTQPKIPKRSKSTTRY